MSYDIYLKHPETGAVAHPTVPICGEGGNHTMGVQDKAELNVTFNYSKLFRFGELYGKTGAESDSMLREIVDAFGFEPTDDYWECTPGNVGRACAILLMWAVEFPTFKWTVHM